MGLLRIVGVDKSAAHKGLERLLPAPIESGEDPDYGRVAG
jgi:hypothetical protein